MAADFKLAQKLRKESEHKLNEADNISRSISDMVSEIRAMQYRIRNMEAEIDELTHKERQLRLEGDRLKNQAFVMTLGEPI